MKKYLIWYKHKVAGTYDHSPTKKEIDSWVYLVNNYPDKFPDNNCFNVAMEEYPNDVHIIESPEEAL